ncbi:MAG: valine--tRNA ligase [Verrucomicrobiae bacterium]|jgi:valyl-tRNA synthetase|nr:valine--tRNA ligase [Verrucomicrobiae bacterium]
MTEIPKAYEPQTVEDKWYQFWQDQNCLKADPARVSESRPGYSIVIPPPNVTGMLHMGHVLNNTIQDILARKARMDGKEVLWLPGTDHAGIATQVMVEKKLKKEEGKSRHDIGREKFLEHVWEWKDKHGGIIINQLKKLGASCDWSRERFTMDEEYSNCVQRVFVDLYKKGLIYRGKRMVNWCPVSGTALSDEEVIMTPQKGFLWYFKVQVAEEPGTWLTIATTRPETIPGDTAVAVNPKDPRYGHLVGKHVVRPLPQSNQKHIPIVADEHIDIEFGTGVLKVTPAHDRADFDIGKRHDLEVIDVLNADGTMNELAGEELAGLERFKARKRAAEILDEMGVLEKEEAYENNVGFSERAKVPIEPRLSEQWFLKYPSVEAAKACVAKGEMKFFPDRWAKTYDHWLEGIQDWCISRQLWWGHQIPVWYHKETGEVHCDLHPPADEANWDRDPDVLDTWFSSWLWPFATMGWPAKSDDLRAFYPTSDLVTGPDIIFFWVARMIMAGYEYMGGLPFKNVYYTGIIRDKKGRKMSKTLGNSPDPLDLIAKYGADALRFGTMRSAPLGSDVLFDEKDVELGRNFCNKLWNACRYRQMQGGETEGEINAELLTNDDKWILLRLDAAIREIDEDYATYRFTNVTRTLYRFFWTEYCGWYLEASKAVMFSDDERRKENTLAVIDFVLGNMLRVFHPFLPFITEELWNGMGFATDLPDDQGGRTIMTAHWPKTFDSDLRSHYGLDETLEKLVDARNELVTKSRNLRGEFNIPTNKRVAFLFVPVGQIDPHEVEALRILLTAESVTLTSREEVKQGTPSVSSALGDLFIPLEGLVDVDAEKARLTKELTKIEEEIGKVKAKLANENFVNKVPASVLEEHRLRQADWESKLESTRKNLAALG